MLVYVVAVFQLDPDWSTMAESSATIAPTESESWATYLFFVVTLIGAQMTPYEADRFAGVVRDLRLDPERAADGSFPILGVVIGKRGALAAAAHRWGFAEGRADGPALLERLFEWADADSRVVPAARVLDWGPERLEIGGAADE